MKKYIILMAFISLFISCNSELNVDTFKVNKKGDNSTNTESGESQLTLQTLSLTSADLSEDVSLSIPFLGDQNDNAIVTFYFCSIKRELACDPLTGESLTLTKRQLVYEGVVSFDTSIITPGDILKYQVVSSDADGVSGGDDSGILYIPFSTTAVRKVRHYGKFQFWKNSLKAGGDDYFNVIEVDSNDNMYIAGATNSDLGLINGGSADIFVMKLDRDGNLVSDFGDAGVVQLGGIHFSGANKNDAINGLKIDESTQSLYMIGDVNGNFSGSTGGGSDGVIIKLNMLSGELDKEFGDGDGEDNDGILQFNNTKILGSNSSSDYFRDLVIHNNSIFIVGNTFSNFGGLKSGFMEDVFVLKIDKINGELDQSFGSGDGLLNDGIVQFNSIFIPDGSSQDKAEAIDVDSSGNVYVLGVTGASMGGPLGGGGDIFLAKLDPNTGFLITSFGNGDGVDNDGILQINNNNSNDASAVSIGTDMAISNSDDIFVTGYTTSNLGGNSAGIEDGIILKINSSDGLLNSSFGDGDGIDNDGIKQFNMAGADSKDQLFKLILSDSNTAFVGGISHGNLGGARSWSGSGAIASDIIIAKFDTDSGELETSLGGGDGILHINNTNSLNANNYEYFSSLVEMSDGKLLVSGRTNSTLGGGLAGGYDGFIIRITDGVENLDTTFGDLDGALGDGIYQFNKISEASTAGDDVFRRSAFDNAGNVYIVGDTDASLGGYSGGLSDIVILKTDLITGVLDEEFGDGDGIDNDGILQINSTVLSDTSSWDEGADILYDGVNSLYVLGRTRSALSGSNSGSYDIVILKIDATNGILDTSFGNGDGSNNDGVLQFNNTFVNSATGSDRGAKLFLDSSNNLYIAGVTYSVFSGGHSGNGDAFLAKLNTTTGLLDTSFGNGDGSDNDGIMQFNSTLVGSASSYESVTDLVYDGTNFLYLVGSSGGSFSGSSAGGSDAFIVKINLTTGLLDNQFGDGDGSDNDGIHHLNAAFTNDASNNDYYSSIALDGSGNLFAFGHSMSDISTAGSNHDAFVIKLDSTHGNLVTNFGDGDGNDDDGILQITNLNSQSAFSSQYSAGGAIGQDGDIYLVGYSYSALSGASTGGYDAFVIKMDPVNGILDSTYGDGDGQDNDGILQINNSIVHDASEFEKIYDFKLDSSDNIYLLGTTEGSLDDVNSSGNEDGILIYIPFGNEGF